MPSDGRYVRFDPKQDDANQVISADHVNLLQDTSERTQQGLFKAQDRDFLDKALFVLEHHSSVNGMWLDMFEDTNKIDLPRTSNLVFSQVEQGIIFPDNKEVSEGYLYSKPYVNENQTNMKKIMVIANGWVPNLSSITIEVSNNNVDWFEVPLSESELFEIPTNGHKLYLRARFLRANTQVSPRLDAWAIYYYDYRNDVIELENGDDIIIVDPTDPPEIPDVIKIMHHQLMGIGPDDHHPQEHSHDGSDGSGTISHNVLTEVGPDDHHPKSHYHGEDGIPYVRLESDVVGTLPVENMSYQVWTGKPGKTGLYFDPKIGDKLVYVKTPDDETYMFYDLVNDRLSHTITIVQGVANWEQMIYGEYNTSTGETTIVLQGTNKKHFDATDSVIRQEIQKITAPEAPKGLRATDTGAGHTVDLSWSPNTELDVVGYNVFRSYDKGITWIQMNTTGVIAAASYTVTNATDGQSVLYSVTALDEMGFESPRSQAVECTSTTRDTIAPDQVKGVAIKPNSKGILVLSWTENTDMDLKNYKVYRSYSGAVGTFEVLNSPVKGTSSYTPADLVPSNTYFFYVTAVDTSGNESIPSNVVSAIA